MTNITTKRFFSGMNQQMLVQIIHAQKTNAASKANIWFRLVFNIPC